MQPILITGASSGFGAHVAAKLAARGWRVIASMRDTTKTKQLDELMGGAGTNTALVEIIRLDVACDESRASAVDYVRDSTPDGLTAVLHCAGYTTAGFFEHLAPQTIRDLLEANFIGAVDLTQRLLPTMRSQGHGTIAVISSNAVNVAHPMYSIYAAAKWALEGWAEAIDIELAPFGLDVKILQPGNHDTPFGSNVQPVLPHDSPYAPLAAKALPRMTKLGHRARPTEKAAVEICDALESDSHQLRIRLGNDDKVMAALSRWVPYTVRRRIVERITGIDRMTLSPAR